jgi:peroxiredoxin
LITQYELESTLRYERSFLEDRKREIQLARQILEQLTALAAQGSRTPASAYETLTFKIDQFVDKQPATPYREALLRGKTMAQLGAKGQLQPPQEDLVPQELAMVNKSAPDFLVEDLMTQQTVSLRRYQGKPVLLVFFHPLNDITPAVLQQTRLWHERIGDRGIQVIGLSMSDDTELVRKTLQREEWKFPVLVGKALKKRYGVDGTPHFTLIDGTGVIQSMHSGWGPYIPGAVEQDLKKLVEPKSEPRP